MRPPIVLPGIVAGGMSPEVMHTLDRNMSRGENLRNYFAAARIFFAAEAGVAVDAKKLDTWRWYVDALTLRLVGATDGETAAAAKAKLLSALELDGLRLGDVLFCKTGEELAQLQALGGQDAAAQHVELLVMREKSFDEHLTLNGMREPDERETTMTTTTTEEGTVSIAGIDKAKLLAALYNEARPIGMGFLRAEAGEMTLEEAHEYVSDPTSQDNGPPASRRDRLSFDYVKGRPLKIDISGDTMRTRLYDRDQGEGKAARVVARLREEVDAMRAPSP